MDDAFFERMHHCFTDREILDLGIQVSYNLSFGRLTRVLGAQGGTTDPAPPDRSHSGHSDEE